MARINDSEGGSVTPISKARSKRESEELVSLDNSTLQSFKLMANGLGFDVHFTVPLTERDKLPMLTEALQKVVTVKVIRYRRKSSRG